MEIRERIVQTRDYLTKSSLPASDFVINPYVGCPHACRYCYARFMKRFTGHTEKWGMFLDVKQCVRPISPVRLQNKSVFLSSVTDCYNHFEEKYRVTRNILQQLTAIDCSIGISTKSSLVLRDVDLLKKCRHLKVSISVNTLDENFKNDMDHASSIVDRLSTLKELHRQGIYTVLFLSPIFPYITDVKSILAETAPYVDEYWFENLNLRGEYKRDIMGYIGAKYPKLYSKYENIYLKGSREYWIVAAKKIAEYCDKNHIKYINYFYHEELVREKRNGKRG